jgi:hypothetical protein
MATSGKGTATVGYNVQIAVDAEHHLIVAHEVINQGYDRHQLAPMALKAQQAMGHEQLTALADRGYFNGDQVLSCEGTGVAPIVPKTLTSSGAKRGFFTRQDFIYDAEHDHYTCPAGAKLTKARRRADHAEDFDFYRHLSACFTCSLKPRCTPTKLRRQAPPFPDWGPPCRPAGPRMHGKAQPYRRTRQPPRRRRQVAPAQRRPV